MLAACEPARGLKWRKYMDTILQRKLKHSHHWMSRKWFCFIVSNLFFRKLSIDYSCSQFSPFFHRSMQYLRSWSQPKIHLFSSWFKNFITFFSVLLFINCFNYKHFYEKILIRVNVCRISSCFWWCFFPISIQRECSSMEHIAIHYVNRVKATHSKDFFLKLQNKTISASYIIHKGFIE